MLNTHLVFSSGESGGVQLEGKQRWELNQLSCSKSLTTLRPDYSLRQPGREFWGKLDPPWRQGISSRGLTWNCHPPIMEGPQDPSGSPRHCLALSKLLPQASLHLRRGNLIVQGG